MRSRPELVLVGVVGIALLLLIATGLLDRRDDAFTLGVVPSGMVAEFRPGDLVCQEKIDVPERFSSIELQVGTYHRPGIPLDVTVYRSSPAGPLLGRGSLPGGYPDVSRERVDVGSVGAEQEVAVCVRPRAGRKVALYGNEGVAAPSSLLRVRGRAVDADLTLVFHKSQKRSLLAEVPDMFARAAVFKAGWVGAWTFWLIALVVVVVLVPLSLVFAIRGLRRS